MREPFENVVHMGLIHCMAFPETMRGEGPVIETLEAIATDDFFTCIEVRRATRPEVLEAEKRLFSRSQMEAIVAGQPGLLVGKHDLNAADTEERKAAIDEAKRAINDAAVLEAKLVALLSGPDPGDDGRSAATDRLVDSLVQLAEYAAVASDRVPGGPIHISLEAFDSDIDKKCLVGPTSMAVEVVERVKSRVPNVGLLIDLSHLPLIGETALQCLTAAGEHLIHVHLGNCFLADADDPAYGDQHPPFGYPGSPNGVAQVTEFLSILGETGYYQRPVPTRRPVLSFEVKPLAGDSPETVIAGAKRIFREAWAQA